MPTTLKRTDKGGHLCGGPSDRVDYIRFCPSVQHYPCDLSVSCRHRKWLFTTRAGSYVPKQQQRKFKWICCDDPLSCVTLLVYLKGQQTSELCIRAHVHCNSHLLHAAAATCTCLLFLCKQHAWEGSSHTVGKTKRMTWNCAPHHFTYTRVRNININTKNTLIVNFHNTHTHKLTSTTHYMFLQWNQSL